MKNMKKLNELAASMSWSTEELLESEVHEDVVTAICTNDGCDFSTSLEPDARGDLCPSCHTATVDSILVIAGII